MKAVVVEQHQLYQDALVALVSQLAPTLAPVGAPQLEPRHFEASDISLIILSTSTIHERLLQRLHRLHLSNPDLPILILIDQFDIGVAADAFSAGVRGIVPKNARSVIFSGALELVLQGEIYIPSTLSPPRPQPKPDAEAEVLAAISPRQREVLELLAAGCSNIEIGHRLQIKESTVKNHVQAIFRAFNVASRTQALIAAANAGLVLHRAGPGSQMADVPS